MKKLFALMVLSILSLPYALMAQDQGTYIEDLNPQDSSYMDQDLMAAGSSSSNTTVIVIVAVVVVAVVAFFLLKKKKKK